MARCESPASRCFLRIAANCPMLNDDFLACMRALVDISLFRKPTDRPTDRFFFFVHHSICPRSMLPRHSVVPCPLHFDSFFRLPQRLGGGPLSEQQQQQQQQPGMAHHQQRKGHSSSGSHKGGRSKRHSLQAGGGVGAGTYELLEPTFPTNFACVLRDQPAPVPPLLLRAPFSQSTAGTSRSKDASSKVRRPVFIFFLFSSPG